MALEGSLRDFDLFSLFDIDEDQGKNGTLVLSQGQEFVKVFFENGEIVGCDSNQVRMEDRLGTMLVRLGHLLGEELLGMVQVQRQTLKRMGTLLLESGKVNPSDLQDALFNQATTGHSCIAPSAGWRVTIASIPCCRRTWTGTISFLFQWIRC